MRYRMKRLLAELLSAVMLLSLLPAIAWAAGVFEGADSGDGSAGNPYQISTAEQLKKLSQYVSGGNNCTDLYFELTADINLEGSADNPWTPIGNQSNKFQGTFDGGGFTVSGLYIDTYDIYAENVGLFGHIDSQGTVKNLGVSGSIKGGSSSYMGGIAGTNYGTITGCHSACEIEGGDYAGGIVGFNSTHSVSDCYNTGSISGAARAGGIIGHNSGDISDCYNAGAVSGKTYAGGIVGDYTGNNHSFTNCYNVGQVTGAGSCGGIAGKDDAAGYGQITYTNCYFLAGTAEKGVGSDTGGTADVQQRSQEQFGTLASELGGAFEDDPFLGRPVLKTNREPWPISGEGTDEHPFEIPDKETLEKVRNYINSSSDGGEGKTFKLTADIDLEGEEWTPIGNRSNQFQGTFDGGGFTVSGLYIGGRDRYRGLFGYIGENGAVYDLTVEGEVSGVEDTGGIAGKCDGRIEKCVNAATVTVEVGTVGGIVGEAGGRASIQNCSNTGAVTGADSVGGIVGKISGNVTIDGCKNTGKISGQLYVGGIAGNSENVPTAAVIKNCDNAGEVRGDGTRTGGVIGLKDANCTVTDCRSSGSVFGMSTVGGVVGYSTGGTVENCYNVGSVTGESGMVGGVVGENVNGTVENCYNVGSVTGESGMVGGVVGYSTGGTIRNCYNTGEVEVTTEHGRCGGVVGSGSCMNSYYLDTCCADGEAGTKKTAAEFASGEVAWLLQEGQGTQVWGQDLTVSSDNYPVLTNAPEKKVYKVTFRTQDKPDYAASYTNQNGTVTLPANPELTGMAFEYWSTTGSPSGDAKFDESTPVTADVIVYAVGRPTFGGEGDEIDLRATFGEESTADLSAYVRYESTPEDPAAGKFTYEIKEDNNDLKPTIDGDKLTIPGTANVGSYILTIVATEITPQYSLMSVDSYGTDPVTLTVKVTIEKADSKAQTPPAAVAGLAYTGEEQALVTAGTPVGGTMQYSLDGQSYSTDIPKGADAKEYTVWYKVVGDANHNDSEPQSVTVTIDKGDGTGTVTMKDYTCGQSGVEPVAASTTNGTANVTFTYSVRGQNNYSAAKPTTAGEYTVKAVFAATDNYHEVTATADFKITHQFNAGWEHRDDGEYHLCACGTGLLLETKELTEVPEGLQKNPNVDTVEEIERVLAEKVAAGDHYVIYDVELEALIGGAWQIITPENLPEEGVAITIPYPAGTSAKYTFTVVHMFTTVGDGHAPGDTEILAATNEADGIHFTVKSFSPIIIGWKAGDLTVKVTDTGENADPARQWQFRVELSDTEITGQYGDMRFTDGVATFTLSSGQSITARGLPEGVAYTVTELEANQDGYSTTCTGEKGLTVSGETMIAAFTNVFAKTEPTEPTPTESTPTVPTEPAPTESTPTVPTEPAPTESKEPEPSKSPETSEGPQDPTVRPSGGGSGDHPSGTPNDTPKTGDEGCLSLWLALMLLSIAGAAVTASPLMGRKRPAGMRKANERE